MTLDRGFKKFSTPSAFMDLPNEIEKIKMMLYIRVEFVLNRFVYY